MRSEAPAQGRDFPVRKSSACGACGFKLLVRLKIVDRVDETPEPAEVPAVKVYQRAVARMTSASSVSASRATDDTMLPPGTIISRNRSTSFPMSSGLSWDVSRITSRSFTYRLL